MDEVRNGSSIGSIKKITNPKTPKKETHNTGRNILKNKVRFDDNLCIMVVDFFVIS
jgi:hypothetical protein